MRRARRAFAVTAFVWAVVWAATAAAAAQSLSTSSNLQLAVERLSKTGSVLMIGAHPDDEDTSLLAYLALGRRMRTGYLSLTRGEGGQNVIGPEQGALLGVIREQELLAARRIDGAEQYFTSAFDFGYSKSPDETLRIWDRDRVLGEIVQVIREFQPEVVVLCWSGTPSDGHGHHQAAGILGREAVEAAADSKRYPEQTARPWTTKKVFVIRRASSPIPVETGTYDPLLGQSYAEIAGVSRSQHRSQAMGTAQVVGPARVYLEPVAGAKAETGDWLDGIESGPARLAPQLIALLEKAASTFAPKRPQETIPVLLQARRMLRSLSGELAERKLQELDEIVLRCAGMSITAVAQKAYAPADTNVPIHVQVVNRSSIGMRLEAVDLPGTGAIRGSDLPENVPVQRTLAWRAQNPVPKVQFRFRIGAEPILSSRPINYRFVDKVLGERTQPFAVVPPASVTFRDVSVLFPTVAPRDVSVRVRSYSGAIAGSLTLALPAGWSSAPASHAFRLEKDQAETTLQFQVKPPSAVSTVDVRAVAKIGGREVDSSVVVIDYPHIPTQTVVRPSAARFTRTDLRVVAKTIGYIQGAGDDVPDAIRQLGCDVKFLSADDLATGDLDTYDTIVTGVRAFNLREDLRANIARLLDYVHRGGSLIVQYNTIPFNLAAESLGVLGPFPIRIGRARVSVEESPVRILNPKSPLLRFPNPITLADFDHWVQERGLYFPVEWDTHYEAPVASNDPGENPLPGGILFARHGEGVYIYTSYSWFRQLPAGVAGAYRIFANMLSQ